MSLDHTPDVLVVGGGIAALCAAISAREAGADVLLVDAAPAQAAGGSTRFATGTVRVAYRGVDDIRRLVPDLDDEEAANVDFGSYPVETYLDDLARLSDYRADPDLAEAVARESFDVARWLLGHGLRFLPTYGRQAFTVNGRPTFWGGAVLEVVGGGQGIVDGLTRSARNMGVRIAYGTPARRLIERDRRVGGAVVAGEAGSGRVPAGAVVIATGGFASNAEWRARYLGPSWDLARTRGSAFATGDGIRMALEVGAAPEGHWSGCHAVAWEGNAPQYPTVAESAGMSRHSYPFGIMVNARGRRFVDEGADFRNYTYGRYGGEVLAQPGQVAWQIFDGRVTRLLREEYASRTVTRVEAGSIRALADRLAGDGVDADELCRTVAEFNAAVTTDVEFRPTVKDGRRTVGLAVPKSNWANPLDTPPFAAYRVTCGVSFTYGGIRAGADGAVLDHAGQPIPGLFAAGACVGGLYYGNSASGSSLISGAVQGRRAGRAAARGTTPRGTATRASVARGSVARGSVARGSVARGSVAR